jgi:putative DNA primase/helicase
MTTAESLPTSLEMAGELTSAGFACIPVPYGQKRPDRDGWPHLRLTQDDLPDYFTGKDNIGVLCGEPSGWRVDVDCDVPEAHDLAAEWLPRTGLVHGRQSNPHSHWWYISPMARTRQFDFISSDGEKTMIVELRASGQTIVPASQHPSGELYCWERHGEPARVDHADLARRVAIVAAGALLARSWPGEGVRDKAAMALCGGLLRAGWYVEDTDKFVQGVAREAGDEEWRDRGKAGRTEQALGSEKQVTGFPALSELLRGDGKRVVAKVREWLNITEKTETEAPSWDDPVPLAGSMPAVEPFDMQLMPAPLRGWVYDMAERMQVPVDYLAVAVMVEAGALIGRRIGIYPKRHDDWLVVPNLWGAIVGGPSMMKTPALDEALKPLDRLATDAMKAYQEECAAFETGTMVAAAKKKARQNRMDQAAKDGNDTELDKLAAEVRELGKSKPVQRRYKTNDGTVEKIAELLLENPTGILVFRDELTGWLRSLDKQGHEGDRSFYLEAWNGTGSFNVDRIQRGSLHVPALCLSVLGGIQPGPLRSYVYGATTADSADNDGLLQRFQLLVWPDPPATWKNVDRRPGVDLRNRAHAVMKALATLTPEACGATTADDDPDAIPALRFSDPAQEVFDQWRANLEQTLRSGELSDALTAHLAKYRSLMPSLALTHHLMAVADGTAGAETGVSLEAAQIAAGWCGYLISHARRLYASAANPTMESAQALAERITSGAVKDDDAVRSIYRKQWSRLTTPDEVNGAIKVLEAYGWVRVESVATAGRKRDVVRINPQIEQKNLRNV